MRDATNYIKQLQDRRLVVSGLAASHPLNLLSSSRSDNWEQAGVVTEFWCVWKCEPQRVEVLLLPFLLRRAINQTVEHLSSPTS